VQRLLGVTPGMTFFFFFVLLVHRTDMHKAQAFRDPYLRYSAVPAKEVSATLDTLATVFRYMKPQEPTSEHPCLPVMREIAPMVFILLTQHDADFFITEKTCFLIKCASSHLSVAVSQRLWCDVIISAAQSSPQVHGALREPLQSVGHLL
jgi:hypothetical protein